MQLTTTHNATHNATHYNTLVITYLRWGFGWDLDFTRTNVCCNTLQNTLQHTVFFLFHMSSQVRYWLHTHACVSVCRHVLQCVAVCDAVCCSVCCSLLQCVISTLQHTYLPFSDYDCTHAKVSTNHEWVLSRTASKTPLDDIHYTHMDVSRD